MIKAVLIVVAIALVIIALVIITNFANKRAETPSDKLEYDERTGVYYDPDVMERKSSKGVVSFRSKDHGDK